MMDTAKMTAGMLWAELGAMRDIEADGGLSRQDRVYLNAIVDEINRRLAAEREALRG